MQFHVGKVENIFSKKEKDMYQEWVLTGEKILNILDFEETLCTSE